MNHKDLLNEVLTGMTNEDKKTTEIPNDVDDAAIDNAIRLPLSTGEIFLVDANAFDWENAVNNLPQIMDNETSFVRMATTLIQIKGDESDEAKAWYERTIKDLEEYLAGYQINVNYREINPNLSDHDLVSLMLFDANNVTRIMEHNISLYSVMRFATCMFEDIDPDTDDGTNNDTYVDFMGGIDDHDVSGLLS